MIWIVGFAATLRNRIKPVEPLPVREHGVDLAQYQPEPPVAETPPAGPTTAKPPADVATLAELPKPDGQEGGQTHA
jgi:hypothetical protein